MKLVFFNLGDYETLAAAVASGGVYGNIYMEHEENPAFSKGSPADAFEVAAEIIEMMGGYVSNYAFVLLSDSGEVLDSMNLESPKP